MLWITNNSIKHQSFAYTQLNDQTTLLQTNQFSINHFFALSLKSQIVLFDPYIRHYQVLPLRAQVNLGSDGNKWSLRIPQSSRITGASKSNFLMSYPEHSLEGFPLCRDAISVLQLQPTELVLLDTASRIISKMKDHKNKTIDFFQQFLYGY